MGKTLLVIGASSDMGMKLITECAQEYDCILAHYRRGSESLQALKEHLGDKLRLMQADLSCEADVLGMIASVKDAGTVPDHIVFFAAPPVANERFHKLPIAEFDAAMNIGIRSTILIAQAFLPAMAKKRHGRLVMLISSVVDGAPAPYCAQYITEKYAMLGLMRALASEYAPKGITVNGVSPSWTNTNYIKNQPELVVSKNIQESPVGRLLTVEEVTASIRFLLSDAAGAVSGQNLLITFGR